MAIICSICGGTDVKCAAVVEPNTKKFIDFGYEAFLDAECKDCGNVTLTDPDEVRADIEKKWSEYFSKHGRVPRYACCCVVQLNHEGCERRYIRIGKQIHLEPYGKVFACCTNLETFKDLTVPDLESGREFTLIAVGALLTKLP